MRSALKGLFFFLTVLAVTAQAHAVTPVLPTTELVLVFELDPERKVEPRASLYDRYGTLLSSHAITGPNVIPRLPFWGVVRTIGHKVPWCPTHATRVAMERAGRALPAGCIPHGHPRHAIGDGFIYVNWMPRLGETHAMIHPAIGAHGTIVPEDLGKYVSRGCYRFHNSSLATVVQSIEGVPTEIHVVPFGYVWPTQTAKTD